MRPDDAITVHLLAAEQRWLLVEALIALRQGERSVRVDTLGRQRVAAALVASGLAAWAAPARIALEPLGCSVAASLADRMVNGAVRRAS